MSFTQVCSLADVPQPGALACNLGGTPVAVVRTADGEVFAVHDQCSHASVPLSEGEVEDCTLECWLHGSRFDLRTGKPTGPPAVDPVPTYPVRVEGDAVLVDLGDLDPTR
jgi:3-phenylpropionate/trans-cinnamate dioxygenase ferredoxin subunit